MRPRVAALPRHAVHRPALFGGPVHYADAFTVTFPADRSCTLSSLEPLLANAAPAWARALMRLRDGIVGRFGLKTQNAVDWESGGLLSAFALAPPGDHHAVVGLDDHHLDFRVLLDLTPQADSATLTMTTLVHFHNAGGRLYFAFVRPFHGLIVRAYLKRLAEMAAAQSPAT